MEVTGRNESVIGVIRGETVHIENSLGVFYNKGENSDDVDFRSIFHKMTNTIPCLLVDRHDSVKEEILVTQEECG